MKKQQPPAEEVASKTPMDPADRRERTRKLLAGRITSEDRMVCYVVDRLRKVIQEADMVRKQLQQAEAQAAQARERMLKLDGMRAAYMEDLETFDVDTPETDEKELPEDKETTAPAELQRDVA